MSLEWDEIAASAWIPTQWERKGDIDAQVAGAITHGIQIVSMRSPFYSGVRYAVRRASYNLNKSGKWEYEPLPSSRTDAFYKRCRFDSFQEAQQAVESAEFSG